MFNQVMSGRILLFMACIGLLIGAYISLGSPPLFNSGDSAEAKRLSRLSFTYNFLYLGVAIIYLILTRWVVVAANQGKLWGRLLGIVLGALLLTYLFPIGAVFGVASIWGYTFGWRLETAVSTDGVAEDARMSDSASSEESSIPELHTAGASAPAGVHKNSCKQCGKHYFTKYPSATQGLCKECKENR